MGSGKIIFLNGTSSAGKSTIAKALQEVMDAPYLHTGIDHFLHNIPSTKVHVFSDGTAETPADGWLIVFRDGVMQTPIIGPMGMRLLKGMYKAIAGFASAGNDVIVDDVIYDPRVLKAAVEALHEFNVLFVGLYCPLEVAQQREEHRGDRAIGGAAAFHSLVHAHGVYDLEIDVAKCSPAECARQIREAVEHNHPCTAFMRLHEMQAE